MLQHLRIVNLALIEHAELAFEPGLVTVTGETGAGKSVLLGALSLVAGNRVGKSIIRQGATSCEVEATLFFPESTRVDALLAKLDLPATEEGALLLRREVHASKAGRVLVNGRGATLAALRELGELWIDFHGPGEPQKLFHERHQLELLDLFADHGEQLEAYRGAYRLWREALAAAEELRRQDKLDPDEETFLRSQLEAIEAVALDEAKLDALERDFSRLDRSRELAETANAVAFGLSGDRGVVGLAGKLLRQARDLGRLDAEAEPLASRVEALVLEAEDLAGDYRRLADAVDFDEGRSASIQRKMQAWMEVKRRFGPDLTSVRAKRDHLRNRLLSQGDVEARLHELEKEAAARRAEAAALAVKLTTRRRSAAETLGQRARELLLRLGFKKPRLEIAVVPGQELTPDGDSSAQYRFSPNPGQDLSPLNQIASSGEAARVMLALKATLAAVDATPVLVFDEVDANVGGEIGAEVGRELARLAGQHQVFCVTHLPQVAAWGQSHWLVEKQQDDSQTVVSLQAIHSDRAARQSELARMLGDRSSASALAHARQLLQASE